MKTEKKMNKVMWWGYLHQNGTLQLKRWFGDHADYTSDCHGNDFVQRVVKPYHAENREAAMQILKTELCSPSVNSKEA